MSLDFQGRDAFLRTATICISFVPTRATENYSYLYQMPVLGGNPRQLIRDIDTPVGFSPDGKQIVFMRGLPDPQQVELRIASADGTGERLLVSLPAFANVMWGASWSPDGKAIAVSFLQSGKEQKFVLNVVRVADASVTTLYSNPALLGRPVWLPGGESLLVAVGSPKENRAQIWEIPYPKGEPRRFTNDLSNYSPYLGSHSGWTDAGSARQHADLEYMDRAGRKSRASDANHLRRLG